MNRLEHLQALLTCLRGDLPAGDDWISIVDLANRALCTPLIGARLRQRGRFSSLPADLQRFLDEIQARNRERNHRLLYQLDEAAGLLNRIGVMPVLLKGTAWLARVDVDRRDERMLSDLDMMVAADRTADVIAQLNGEGYELETPAVRPDVPIVLSRPTDAATIDLHTEYGSAATLHYRHADLVAEGSLHRLEHGSVYLPSPVSSVAILLLHDQLKGRDYLRGRVDLRHLLDIQSLSEGFDESAWQALLSLFAPGYARTAAQTHLLTAERLLGLNVPKSFVAGFRVQLQYYRRLLQIRWPAMALPLTLLSLLDPQYLRARRTRRVAFDRSPLERGSHPWNLPRRASVERLFSWKEIGKI